MILKTKINAGKPFKYPNSDSRRPAVPSHREQPQMGTKSTKNFITTNAVNNIMSVSRKPAPKYVDTAVGAKHDLGVCTCTTVHHSCCSP